MPIILAILLSEVKHKYFKRSVQTITYLPHFISLVVVVGMMKDICAVDYGIVNRILGVLGAEQILFFSDPTWFKPLYIISDIWQGIGWGSIIMMRSFFDNIPDSLEEAVKIDGVTDITVFIRIFIPLSTPVIAVIALYYAVGHWNSFTSALIYLRDRSLFPLQVVLRELLLQNKVQEMVSVSDSQDILGVTRSIYTPP